MATGYGAMSTFATSVIAPDLLAEFGWSMSAFAMLSTISLLAGLSLPFAGRLADVMGVRRTALIGIVAMPLTYFAYSLMSGAMWQYIAIYCLQSVFCITTTSTVYSRIAVQHSQRARGLALAIVATGPALSAAIGGPLLNLLVEAQGWQAAYRALALFTAVAGAITMLLLPREPRAEGAVAKPKRRARDDYPAILRSHAFWFLAGSMVLCNLPQVVFLSQLKLVLIDNGIAPGGVGVMLSAFALGTLAGRFLTGLALDHMPPHLVGFVCMGLPAVGLLLLASSLDTPAVLTFATLCFGFSFGSEGDIVGYLVARNFALAVYGSVLGLLTLAMSIAASSGAALLSVTLTLTGGFDFFLVACAVTVLLGSFMLLPLKGAKQAA